MSVICRNLGLPNDASVFPLIGGTVFGVLEGGAARAAGMEPGLNSMTVSALPAATANSLTVAKVCNVNSAEVTVRRMFDDVQVDTPASAALDVPPSILTHTRIFVQGTKAVVHMPYHGQDLVDMVNANTMTAGLAQSIVTQVAEALAFLHSNGFAYLDLKPENVVFKDGVAKLCDFDMCRPLGSMRKPLPPPPKHATRYIRPRAEMVGTTSFISPEMAIGGVPCCSEKTDVWGLGHILYAMLFSTQAFGHHMDVEIMFYSVMGPPPPCSRTDLQAKDLTEKQLGNVRALLGWCFAHAAEERPSIIEMMLHGFFAEGDDESCAGGGFETDGTASLCCDDGMGGASGVGIVPPLALAPQEAFGCGIVEPEDGARLATEVTSSSASTGRLADACPPAELDDGLSDADVVRDESVRANHVPAS